MRRYPFSFGTFALLFTCVLVACEHQQPAGGGGGTVSPGPNSPGSVDPGVSPVEQGPPVVIVNEAPLPADPLAPIVAPEGACAARTLSDPKYLPGYTPDPAVQAQAKSWVAQMTIEQKVNQLIGIPDPGSRDGSVYEDIQRSQDDAALAIKGWQWRDGPHGLNLEAGAGRLDLENYATSFPVSVAQGASFDLDVVYRMGEAMGDETAAAGFTVLLGPCMNLLRHPYWGRAQETFGEDTFHLGRIASAYTAGLQQFITGCAKHYAGNNIEIGRFTLNAQMDEQTLREVYGRHFEMVVQDGGVGCVMAAYNSVNGVKSTQNKHLLKDILRDDFGFQGMIITDWWAMPADENGQGLATGWNAPQDEAAAKEALEATLDVELPWALNYDAIPRLIENGAVTTALVDQAVERVLEQKLRFNAHNMTGQNSLKRPSTTHTAGSIQGNEAHVQLAQEGAEKGMVLLKNEGNVLPIPATAAKVAVIGAKIPYVVGTDGDTPENPRFFDFARDPALGDRGSSRVRPNPAQTTGPLAGITATAPQGTQVVGGETAAEAADADFVVVVVGLTAGDEGEEYTGAGDRESLSLGDTQNALVADVAALGKPMVVVIEAGGAVDMPWLASTPAVVMAWYPGQSGGAAMGRLLFGQTNFAGRLPVTWPTSIDQFPVFNEGNTTVMDYYAGYRWFEHHGHTPLYAFGHGLSYSTFEYSGVQVPCETISKSGVIEVKVGITNTSQVAGDEVIMVFASYPNTTARRSAKELKGFHRVNLEPGEGKLVTIPIRVQDLKYWDMSQSTWVVESGPVLLQVGPSSDRLDLSATVNV